MFEIRWTPEASANLEAICLHIAQDSPVAAAEIAAEILARMEQLSRFPNSGRPGREQGTRELVFAPLPWIAVYRVREAAVEVLHIWHGAQRRRQPLH